MFSRLTRWVRAASRSIGMDGLHPARVEPESEGLITSPTFFSVTPELVAELEAARARHTLDRLETQLDAFMLDAGMGPATLLTRDGRVVMTDDWGPIRPSAPRAYAAIVVGARKTGVADLLLLLPARPSHAAECRECAGAGWVGVPPSPRFICMLCGAMGWRRDVVDVSLRESAWIDARVEAYADEAPRERQWLTPFVQEHHAFPLNLGFVETEAIRADGSLISWSTESTYSGTRPVDDPFRCHQLLGQASREYPNLECLAPIRLAGDLNCAGCDGAGGFAHAPEVVCYCGGLGWIPRDVAPLLPRAINGPS